MPEEVPLHDRRRPRDSTRRAAAVAARRLKHLASLHNPLFYERQRLRLSTHQTPRLIRCYEEDLTHCASRAACSPSSRRRSPRRQPARDRGPAAEPRAAAARVPRRADAAAADGGHGDARTRERRARRAARQRQDGDGVRADRGTEAADTDPRPQQAAARPVARATEALLGLSPKQIGQRAAAGAS